MHAVLMAVRAFVSAGLRPRSPLARGIVATLCVKVCVVVALRLFVFGGDARVTVDPSVMNGRLMPAAARDGDN